MTTDIVATPANTRLTPWKRRDAAIGTVIAIVMIATFVTLTSGASLLVTFVPGVVMTWIAFVYLYRSGQALPDVAGFLPVFVLALAVQFVHFAEEFATGFPTDFAVLYGGDPYGQDLFVIFNMSAYAIFAVAAVAVVTERLAFLLVPAMFFLVYGAIANAISHTWWSIMLGDYFPGLVTAQLFWVVGPLALDRLTGGRRRRQIVIFTVAWAAVLIPLLTIFAEPSSLGH
jgi:hypothetical protein